MKNKIHIVLSIFLFGICSLSISLFNVYAETPKISSLDLTYNDDDLYSIRIEQNGSPDFPKQLFLFPDTKRIVLYYCYFEKIPDDFEKFEKLEEIQISKCYRLDYEELFKKLNKNLKDVKLYSDSLRSLPKSLSQHINLKSMDCSNNLIEFVPKEILTLKNLTYLDLSENFVKTFIIDSPNSSKIKRLDLSKNRLFKLPSGLDNLKKLEDIYLDYNWELTLYDICEVASKLPQLKSISFCKHIVLDKFEEDEFDKMDITQRSLPTNINNLIGKTFIFDCSMIKDDDIFQMGKLGIIINDNCFEDLMIGRTQSRPRKVNFSNNVVTIDYDFNGNIIFDAPNSNKENHLKISIYDSDFLFKREFELTDSLNKVNILDIFPNFRSKIPISFYIYIKFNNVSKYIVVRKLF